ncbi:MAG: type II toxin-antitoxin system RelE/ParE family toxin [Verrucomicrobia bacterium]|nr:type II toxin-antitoxin system RelE/ParE family toxin [Verrucomicrobiota bacterium]
MSLKLVRSKISDEDLASIWQYIAFANPNSGDPEAADRVLDAISKTYEHLVDFSHKTSIKGRNLYRAVIQGFPQYNVLYRFNDESVEVLRVFRAELDWTQIIDGI